MKRRKRRPAQPYEMEYIKNNYKTVSKREMGRYLDRDHGFVFRAMKRMGLETPPEKLAEFESQSRFKKGNIPPNKGKKMEEFMSSTQLKKFKAQQFKKGCVSHNHKPIGSERICIKDGYVLVKTAEPNTWKLKQRVIWEKKHGSVPEGYLVSFINGDKLDVRIENLELICMTENVIRNSVHKFHPKEVKTRVLLSKIKNKIKERNKQNGT